MTDDTQILEGFLCPLCLQDLGDLSLLEAHFAEKHGDKDVRVQIKGLFERAKKRLAHLDPTLYAPILGDDEFQPHYAPQKPGPTRSHFTDFKNARDSVINDFILETNKLIVRLDKLIAESPDDLSRRKAFEKTIAPWVKDNDAQFCEFCKRRFTITRRRHHCRLCGRLVCADCSRFLTFAYARKLTNPAFASSYVPDPEDIAVLAAGGSPSRSLKLSLSGDRLSQLATQPAKRLAETAERMKAVAKKAIKDGSEVSLSSLLNQDGEEHLRICSRCRDLLDKRDQQLDQRNATPIVAQMYERLSSFIADVQNVFPAYLKMAESLRKGESSYDLQTAQDMRLKLMKLHEQIDSISKKIAAYAQVDEAPSVHTQSTSTDAKAGNAKMVILQRNIRVYATGFLKDLAVSMPEMPTAEQYQALRQRHHEEVQRQIELEKREHERLQQQISTNPFLSRLQSAPAQSSQFDGSVQPGQSVRLHGGLSPGRERGRSRERASDKTHPATKAMPIMDRAIGSRATEGWTVQANLSALVLGDPSQPDDAPIDPLYQQICIIKEYIRQAAAAGRTDEMEALQKNLSELRAEWESQKRTRSSTLRA